MKSFLLYLSLLLFTITGFSQTSFEWALACGNPFYSETSTKLASDDAGNVIMAGGFVDTAWFANEMLISNGGSDFFISKYSSAGEMMWISADGGTGWERIRDVAVSEQGFFVCGTFYGNTHIGSEVFPSIGSQDIFLAGYDHDGKFSWAKHIGNKKSDHVNASCTDANGNLIITGHFYDTISIESAILQSGGASDVYIIKYSPAGELLWLEHMGGSSSDQSYSISADGDGNIVISGSYFYDITIGDTTLTTADPTGVFYTVYSADGEFQYAYQVDGTGLIAQSFAEYDTEGNIMFVGNFTEQVHLGPYNFDAGVFNIDVFVTKFSGDGQIQWADHGTGLSSDQLISISSGPLNDLYISGHYMADITFGDITLVYNLCCGQAEIFLVRYTEDGTAVWGNQITGETAMAEDMVKNANDELFVTGMFRLQLAFGGIILETDADFENFLTGVATETMTSLSEEMTEEELIIYPNPAENYLFVNSTASYKIYDISGRLLKSGTSDSGKVDVSYLNPGYYVIELRDKDDVEVLKFCKR